MYILDTWSLTLDIWHWDLTWYYLAPDTWHLISDTGTWYAITWHLIPVLDMLSLDTWYLTPDIWHLIIGSYHLILDICYHLVLTHLTWYCNTWLNTITPDTCNTLHIHDYHFNGDLDMIIILLPADTPKLLNSSTPELLYSLYSCPLNCYSC